MGAGVLLLLGSSGVPSGVVLPRRTQQKNPEEYQSPQPELSSVFGVIFRVLGNVWVDWFLSL